MELKALKALLKTLRENGVLSYKHEGVELQLSHDFLVNTIKVEQNVQSDSTETAFPPMSQEDMMFYSSGGAPAPEEN